MKYGSVASGIEAATVAWHPLGWEPQWFSEIEPFPCKLLKHHYPNVPNLGDMLKLETNEQFKKSTISLLVGGTPCQSFSLAGLRGGMADERGNLALEFCRLLIIKRPKWFLWENVPGVFSSFSNAAGSPDLSRTGRDNGRNITETADFATLLTAFSECGYSCAWRVFDSQYFGVPQRRRRVFVVGHIGNDWRPSFAVLFERQSLQRNFAPLRQQEKDVAGTIEASTGRSRGAGISPGTLISEPITGRPYSDRGSDGNLTVVPPIHAQYGAKHGVTNQDIKQGLPHLINGTWWDGGQTAQTLDAVLSKGQTMPEKNRFPAVLQQVGTMTGNGDNHTGFKDEGGIVPVSIRTAQTSTNGCGINTEGTVCTLDQTNGQASFSKKVRRLTPLECERLQGFPDNYTNIPGASDSPRYKALGNSMTVNVMQWIGKRIDRVDKLLK